MISLRPFRAWRPVPEKAALVGSRSYVSYTPAELEQKLKEDPFSFLHVIHPPESSDENLSRQERFRTVRTAFRRFCGNGIMMREEAPAIYVYEQHSHGNTSRGIITGVSIQDHLEGRIKVHEQTLTAREQLFTEYLDITGINAEPVLLTTPPGSGWEDLLFKITTSDPVYEFNTRDGVRHRLWASTDLRPRELLQEAFAKIPALYIADGHHRMASSARLAQEQGSKDVDPKAWCLAYIVPHGELYIYNFDRAIIDDGGVSEEELLKALGRVGTLMQVRSPKTAPGTICVRTPRGWHSLMLPEAPRSASPAEKLDAARLNELVLDPVYGMTDLRNEPRIKFIPGTEGTAVLEEMVRNGKASAAFHLHPVSFKQLRAVADTNGSMPPKTTYIEPKLRSGLTVYSLEDV